MYLDVNEIEIDQKPLDALSELPIYYYEYGGTQIKYIIMYLNFANQEHRVGKNVLLCIDHSLLVDGPSDSEKVNGLAAKLNIIKRNIKLMVMRMVKINVALLLLYYLSLTMQCWKVDEQIRKNLCFLCIKIFIKEDKFIIFGRCSHSFK